MKYLQIKCYLLDGTLLITKDEIRRFDIEYEDGDSIYTKLIEGIEKAYKKSVIGTYWHDDDDFINFSSDEELEYAFEFCDTCPFIVFVNL